MADIETNVVISAQIDGLRSGMEAAANSVQAATDAMRSQLAGLGDIAQQVQSQLNAATGQIGTGIGVLQTKAADLAGSVAASMTPNSGLGDVSSIVQASPASGTASDVAADEKLWAEELAAYQKFQSDKEKLDIQAAQTSQRTWQTLMQPIQRAFDTSITGMILGTTTLQKAVGNIAQSILAEFVNLGVKMATNWIASEVHQNEMILPANISQGLQNMISGNGGAGAGAVVINVSAIDSQDVKRFFQSNGSLLVNAVNKAMRNGAMLRTA